MAVGVSESHRHVRGSRSARAVVELIPVNTPREDVITPLGRYFEVHGRRCEQSDHRGTGGRL
jgi:hypothetical protein